MKPGRTSFAMPLRPRSPQVPGQGRRRSLVALGRFAVLVTAHLGQVLLLDKGLPPLDLVQTIAP
jgi:hypothetical protein